MSELTPYFMIIDYSWLGINLFGSDTRIDGTTEPARRFYILTRFVSARCAYWVFNGRGNGVWRGEPSPELARCAFFTLGTKSLSRS